ncbi:DUF2254 domain-containing protein [soil metagenome]
MRLRRPGPADRARPWFLPGSVALGFVLLALIAGQLDRRVLSDDTAFGFDGDAGAARTVLSTIAGSLITVAGLAFTLTILTVQLVSSQFTPRAIAVFLQDRFNQVTVGCFAGVFAYCVVVLRSIRSSDEAAGDSGFVPGLGVNLGILLGLGSVQLLVVFIYRVGRSIDVADIATRLGRDTRRSVDGLYPDGFGTRLESEGGELVAAWRALDEPRLLYAGKTGYVSQISLPGFTERLERYAGRVHLLVCPGDFVTERTVLAEIWVDPTVAEQATEGLADRVVVSSQRTLDQDSEFGVRQLTDIALRAISPGVNDPSTAVMCIGYLRDILEELAGRDLPTGVVVSGQVTLVLRRRDFADYLHGSVIELSRYASSDARVTSALLEALEGVASAAVTAGATDRAQVVAAAIEAVSAPALADARSEVDRGLLRRQMTRAQEAVRGGNEITSPTAR